MSNIKKGYKQTDIGVIPEDWEVGKLENLITVLTDFTANGSFASLAENVTYLESPNYARLVRLTDIRANFKNAGVYLTKESYGFLKKSKLFGNELLLANVGAYAGYSFLYPSGLNFIGSLGPNMFLIKLDETVMNAKYAFYCFTNGLVFEQLLSKATSSAQPKLNKQNVRECDIIYSRNLTEQSAIATALSDTDALIAALDKKIAKKQQIKLGAMQQLLTGKKRLPGFSGKWVEKKLGAIGKTYGGLTGKTKDDFGNGDSYYITFLNILNNPVINTDLIERVRIKSTEHQNKALKNDLFFNTSSETPEEVGICSVLLNDIENLYLNSFCFGYRINDNEVHGLFLSYLFRSKQGRELMTSLAQGATRYNLSKSLFNQSLIKMPATKTEQTAIAHILTDMDNEIVQLEKERNKYKEIKAGMMQVLLTGKIRLI